jgi:hypothetical protein
LFVAHNDLLYYKRFNHGLRSEGNIFPASAKINTPAAFKRKLMNSFCARSADFAFEPASNFYQAIPAGLLAVAGCASGETLLKVWMQWI